MTQSHETQTPYETAETIAQAFDTARKEIVGLTSDHTFHDACLAQRPEIDPYDDMDKPAYWETFANFAYKSTEREKQEQGPSLLLDTKQLLAETPRFLFAQMQLDHRESLTQQEKNYALPVSSYYNQLLRSFAYNHPEANVSDVKKGLEIMANQSIEDETTLKNASRTVYATLHGAQHELAFGQILSYTGKQYAAANTEQDLQGADYIVAVTENQTLGIDVKASDRLVANGGKSQYPFTVRATNKIIAHSLTADTEFHDKFFTSEEIAAAKAPYLNEMLTKAAKLAA